MNVLFSSKDNHINNNFKSVSFILIVDFLKLILYSRLPCFYINKTKKYEATIDDKHINFKIVFIMNAQWNYCLW